MHRDVHGSHMLAAGAMSWVQAKIECRVCSIEVHRQWRWEAPWGAGGGQVEVQCSLWGVDKNSPKSCIAPSNSVSALSRNTKGNHLQQGPQVVISWLVLHAQILQLERNLAQPLCRTTKWCTVKSLSGFCS